jgi:hypothetical protein
MPSPVLGVAFLIVARFASAYPYWIKLVLPRFRATQALHSMNQLIPSVGIGAPPFMQPRPHLRGLNVTE